MDVNRQVYLNKHELTELDTSSRNDKFRLTSPGADVKINESTRRLLQFIEENQGRTVSYIVQNYPANGGVSPNSLKSTLETLFKKGVLVEKRAELNGEDTWKKDNLSYRGEMENLWFRRKLLDVDRYSGFFENLGFTLSKPFVTAALVSFLVLDGYFFYSTFFSSWTGPLKYYSSFDYLFLFPLGELMLILHELGHAVAIKRHRLPMPKGIGIGLYYFMVVLYADTHESWNLPRSERAVVSVAGIYWNIIALVFLIPACLVTKSAALKDFILLVHISALSIFNPFLKMDGYWLLTDLLGVINLQQKVRQHFGSLFLPERQDEGTHPNPFQGYPDKIRYFTNIYGLFYFVFLGAFLGFFLYRAALIIDNFEVAVLGKFTEILGTKTGSRGNIAGKINHVIRNIVILTGAAMLTFTGGQRVLAFLSRIAKA